MFAIGSWSSRLKSGWLKCEGVKPGLKMCVLSCGCCFGCESDPLVTVRYVKPGLDGTCFSPDRGAVLAAA